MKLDLQKAQNITGTPKKKREENLSTVVNSSINDSIISSRGIISRSLLGGVTLRSQGLGSLVNHHLLIHLFEIQVLQVNSNGMLDEVPPQKLKTFKVPTEEHYVVLVSLLESLDGPSSNSFKLLLGSQKLVVLFQG